MFDPPDGHDPRRIRIWPGETTLNAPISSAVRVLHVRGQQNGAPSVGLSQNLLVGNAGRQLRHIDDVMAVLSEALHDGAVDTFICDQVHADLALMG
jgi:hypothetical protein